MRSTIGILAAIGIGAVGVALADAPATPAAAPSATAAPAQPATPAQPAAPPSSQVLVTTKADAVDAAEEAREKHFLAEGYKLEMRNGQKVFCRREDTLGTRLGSTKVCTAGLQLEQTEKQAQASVSRSSMQQNNPTGR